MATPASKPKKPTTDGPEKPPLSMRSNREDPLAYFITDGPGWKLAALVVCRTGGILAGLAAVLVAIDRFKILGG